MITQLTEKIWIIPGKNHGRYPNSHSLYIRDGGGFLIDAGCDRGAIERLRKEEGISAIVMTHYHGDHLTSLSSFQGTEIWATVEDAPAIESLETILYRVGALGAEWEVPVRELYRDIFFDFQGAKVTRIVSDGEELRFGTTRAVAMVMPGHTPGHLTLHFPDDGILFLCDYDLSPFGPAYGDVVGDIEAFRRSGRRLAAVGAERNVVSHDAPVYRGSITGKMEEYLAKIDRREEALREYLKIPRTRVELFRRRLFYGTGRDGPLIHCGEWGLVSRHLDGMIGRGEVVFQDGIYCLAG